MSDKPQDAPRPAPIEFEQDGVIVREDVNLSNEHEVFLRITLQGEGRAGASGTRILQRAWIEEHPDWLERLVAYAKDVVDDLLQPPLDTTPLP